MVKKQICTCAHVKMFCQKGESIPTHDGIPNKCCSDEQTGTMQIEQMIWEESAPDGSGSSLTDPQHTEAPAA